MAGLRTYQHPGKLQSHATRRNIAGDLNARNPHCAALQVVQLVQKSLVTGLYREPVESTQYPQTPDQEFPLFRGTQDLRVSKGKNRNAR